MEILAEFEDIEYGENCSPIRKWFWGLGSDGELYYRWHILDHYHTGFVSWQRSYTTTLTLKQMYRITEEFKKFYKMKAFW